jgi:hypothetical protein
MIRDGNRFHPSLHTYFKTKSAFFFLASLFIALGHMPKPHQMFYIYIHTCIPLAVPSKGKKKSNSPVEAEAIYFQANLYSIKLLFKRSGGKSGNREVRLQEVIKRNTLSKRAEHQR